MKFKILFFFVIATLILTIGCQQEKKSEENSQTNSIVQATTNSSSSGWNKYKEIEESIQAPNFKDTDFNIQTYKTDQNTYSQAIKDAIEACSQSGGGRVLIPAGEYDCGPIHLLDNVNLHLEKGAEIKFSRKPTDYLPLVHTSFEGIELMNYSPLIYAYGQKNIAVTGEGLLNGQANDEYWWPWKGHKDYGWKDGKPSQKDSNSRLRLLEMGENGVPVSERLFGEGHNLRPTFIEFFECENILIKDVKIIAAPFWVIHPIKSNNITIDGVEVDSHGPNNDGCDPEYCKNVLIQNCIFNTGDDCIAIKSGRNEDGRRVAIKSERIIVRDCQMIDGHGGVVMGSEISAGVSDVYVENCSMDSPNLDRAIRIKSNSKRGGLVENIYVRNIEIGKVKEAVLKINMFYATYDDQEGKFIPEVRNVNLENINVKDGGYYGILAKGHSELPIDGITFKNVKIERVDEAYSLENVKGLRLIDTYINGSLMQSPPSTD